MKRERKKLLLMLDVFASALSDDDTNNIANTLQKDGQIVWKNEHQVYGIELCRALIDAVCDSIKKRKQITTFINAINNIGKKYLGQVVKTFIIRGEESSTIRWFIEHWKALISCNNVLTNLFVEVDGLPENGNIGVDQWLDFIYQLSTNPRNSKYYVIQLKINVSIASKDDDTLGRCFSEVFSPIFQEHLSDEEIEFIITSLCSQNILEKDVLQKLKKSGEKCQLLCSAVSSNFNQNCVTSLARLLLQKDHHLLSMVATSFFKQGTNNGKLLWLLLNLSELLKHARKVLQLVETHKIFSKEELDNFDTKWCIGVIIKTATSNESKINDFMNDLLKLVGTFKVQVHSCDFNSTAEEDGDVPTTSTEKLQMVSSGFNSKDNCNKEKEVQSNIHSTSYVDSSNNSKPEAVLGQNSNDMTMETNEDWQSIDTDQWPNRPSYASVAGGSTHDYELRSCRSYELKGSKVQRAHDKPELVVCLLMVVDEKVPVEGQMCVFVEHLYQKDGYYQMSYDRTRNFFSLKLTVLREREFVYKYLWYSFNNELWEFLPGSATGFVNRKANIHKEDDGCIILFDVANFHQEKIIRSSFTSMYTRNISRFLPDIAQIEFGNVDSSDATSITWDQCLIELMNWLRCARNGVQLTRYGYFAEPVMIFSSCRSELEKYVMHEADFGIEGGSPTSTCKRILAFLALLVLAKKKSLFVDKPKVLEALCGGLSVVDVQETNLAALHEVICSSMVSTDDEVAESILCLNKKLNPLQSLQLLPLYYVLINKGNCSYNVDMWTTAIKNLGLERKLSKERLGAAEKLFPNILKLKMLFPEILQVFQVMLPISMVLDLLNRKVEFVKHLSPSMFITPLLEECTSSYQLKQYFGSNELFEWLYSYLDRLEKSDAVSDENRRKIMKMNKAFQTFGKHVNCLKDLDAVENDRFLRIAIKLLSCNNLLLKHQRQFDIKRDESCKLLIHICTLFGTDGHSSVNRSHIQIWNVFLTANLRDESLNEQWHNAISDIVQQAIMTKLSLEYSNVLDVFESQLDEWKASVEVQSCFSEALFKFAMGLKNEDDESGIFKRWFQKIKNMGQSPFKKLIQVFQRMFSSTWEKWHNADDPINSILDFIYHWPFILQFFQLFNDAEQKKSLAKETTNLMDTLLSQIQLIEMSLWSGDVLFKHVCKLADARANLGEVLSLCCIDPANSKEMMKQRIIEYKNFLKLQELIICLVQLCAATEKVNFELTTLKEKLEADFDNICWRDIVQLERENNESIFFPYFNLSTEVLKAIEEIHALQVEEKELLKQTWNEQAHIFCVKKEQPTKSPCSGEVSTASRIASMENSPAIKPFSSLSRTASSSVGDDDENERDEVTTSGDDDEDERDDVETSGDDEEANEYLTNGESEDSDVDDGNDNGDSDILKNVNLTIQLNEIPLVWSLVKKEVASLTKDILMGSIVLSDVKNLFDTYVGNKSKMHDLLFLLRELHAFFDLSDITITESHASMNEGQYHDADEVDAKNRDAIYENQVGASAQEKRLCVPLSVGEITSENSDEDDELEESSCTSTDEDVASKMLHEAESDSDDVSDVDTPGTTQTKTAARHGVVAEKAHVVQLAQDKSVEHGSDSSSDETSDGSVSEFSSDEPEPVGTVEDRLNFRIDQIYNYFALQQNQDVASVFSDLKACLKLKGDFSYLKIVQKQESLSGQRPLKSITKKVMQASESIKNTNHTCIDLMKGFMEHQDLIDWLIDNMKDRGEVKVMSDLAMISAGETAVEVDRVSCFLSAVMGFASFIFDLERDSDLNAMLEASNKVVQCSDPAKLIEQWNATARYLEWLKGIKDFHGSVEKSSLARAQDINSRGRYTIGGEKEKIPSLENALRMDIAVKEGEEKTSMTLSDLHSLESRLMLIAGEAELGLHDVKAFTETLSLVEKLEKVYVKLKSSGCLLFNDWTAVVRCVTESDESSPLTSSIEIMFDEHCPIVFCHKNVKEELKKLTAVLENVYFRWKESLNDKRKEFYELNHFNIQQIMYLCNQLARVTDRDDIPDQVYTLLECVKQGIKKDEIIAMLHEATKVPEDDEDDLDANEEDDSSTSQSEQKRRMARRLLDEDVSEYLAKAAVQSYAEDDGFPLDYKRCYIKALKLETMEHEKDDELRNLVSNFDRDAGFDASSQEVNVIQSVVNDRSSLTLKAVIADINQQTDESGSASVVVKTVCERYLTRTAVTSLSDCISLEHLGILLRNLGNSNPLVLRRDFPEDVFEKGKPNLVICSENDVFSTLLSLYMQSSQEPLPSLSEVLLCSEHTTKNEVEIFLRRAIAFNYLKGAPVFCLASAEKLSFHITNETVRMIKEFETKFSDRENYRLVVLCSSSQHYVASLLYENRVDYTVRFSPPKIQQYLSNHLKLNQDLKTCLHVQNKFELLTSVILVGSGRAGLGKSLHIQRCCERLPANCRRVVVRLLDKDLDEDEIMKRLLPQDENIEYASAHFVHFDVTPSVKHGVSKFLFNLLILGGFCDAYGTLWRRQSKHVYFLEHTNSMLLDANFIQGGLSSLQQSFFNLLPFFQCLSPQEVVSHDWSAQHLLLMDQREFESDVFQRPYQYLQRYALGENLDQFSYNICQGTPVDCIKSLLKYCGMHDPTWSELRHFASFLNRQLRDCEKSFFCDLAVVGNDSGLSGFKKFVVRFMIRMARDFATPSLSVADKPVATEDEIFQDHQLRRRWEEDVHPYLFFNEDHITMTFLNFSIDNSGNLLHPKHPVTVLERNLLSAQLLAGLRLQKITLNQDFDSLSRQQKLLTLCRVMGLNESLVRDPDPNYELTTDNILKILAIHMRFRCEIPVVVMGETGCGKTRMVEFMSKVKKTSLIKPGMSEEKIEAISQIQNMVVVKVHGGVSVPVIQENMKKAAHLAQVNKEQHGLDTMLFLDEANTTEAIYAIKEFVCDKTINGEGIQGLGLQIICACNPYKKHEEEAIQKMSEAGLGFRVKTEDTTDKLGNIPMRCLVYRVIALPPSMQPLVWDFGQLSEEAERVYIEQMVLKRVNLRARIFSSSGDHKLIVNILSASQSFMRQQRSQCLFVSLRDVERCLQSFQWFYDNGSWLYQEIDGENEPRFFSNNVVLRSLIHAIGMCYHVTLDDRLPYREHICYCLRQIGYDLTPENIHDEITSCQSVFSNSLNLDDNIARNEALRENSFMIAMCTEMRIPLFLIGKPGSSKSLAKTIVTDAMQGPSSTSKIFQKLKQIHVLSFQCSAVSDAVGIEAVFTQCAQVQANQDPSKFVSVVVLDEVGLAEDSPKMPLKVLHPLLEGGLIHSDCTLTPTESTSNTRVGFVGISNWALDPAKMNRGIFVVRGDPTDVDLQLTAKGIFSDLPRFAEIDEIVKLLTDSYLEIRKEQSHEFFGLRDYYGLLKMIFAVVKEDDDDEVLNFWHVSNAIKRNFSGGQIDCFDIFLRHLKHFWPRAEKTSISLEDMVRDNLQSVNNLESRFLLLLTNRFAAVNLLNKIVNSNTFQVIFGSSFPQDNDYTELCRNINKIKICMESGCTVVLLNLRDLYESLYDALNQHYVTFAGQRYVDLGLGGHRVKCRVSKKFRLIVIEDKNVVYNEFPIPLINRLEKYIFTSESVLQEREREVAHQLDIWMRTFSTINIPVHERRRRKPFTIKECFLGYTEDSAAAAVLHAIPQGEKDVRVKAQNVLLSTATVDSVFRLQKTKVKNRDKFQQKYLMEQSHDNLVLFFKDRLDRVADDCPHVETFVYEFTSLSQILSEQDRQKMETALDLPKNSVMLLTLQQFKSQEDYSAKIETFFDFCLKTKEDFADSCSTFLLFIQCPQAFRQSNLIACARFTIKNLIQNKVDISKGKNVRIFVAFLYTMDRQSGLQEEDTFSFHSDFSAVFIDELRPSVDYIGSPSRFWNKTIGAVFEQSMSHYPSILQLPCKLIDPDYLLNPVKLVQSCIPGAIAKIASSTTDRNRVLLLHKLYDSDNLKSSAFQQILLTRLSTLLHERDENLDALAWSVQEACSNESLYEGGTFAKTLWLRLKSVVTLCLAKIISVLDEDNNLDFLFREGYDRSFLEFWFHTFQDSEICRFSTAEILRNVKEFEVRGNGSFSCQFPFSRSIVESFSQQWNFVQSLALEEKEMKFYERVKEMKVDQRIVDVLSGEAMRVLTHFVNDVICLESAAVSENPLEFKLVESCLCSMFKAKWRSSSAEEMEKYSNYLAVAYHLYASSQQEILQMHLIIDTVPGDWLTEENVEKWSAEQKNHSEFVVHLLVFADALSYLEKNLNKMGLLKLYEDWKSLVGKMLSFKITYLDRTVLPETIPLIQKLRRSVAFVDLFLSVLLPEGLPNKDFEHYLGILGPMSKRLYKGAQITGFTSTEFLLIVMDILRNCSKELRLKLLLSFKDLACRLCHRKKVIDPVILPCDDYFCKSCIQLTTISNVNQCPLCRKSFPSDYQIVSAQLSPEKLQEFDNFKRCCTSFFLQYLSTLCFPAANESELGSDTLNKDIWTALQNLVIRQRNTRELTPMDMDRFDETPTVRSFILQLLLRYNREETEEVLESHFLRMEDVFGDKKELMLIYIRCLEDCLQIQANQARTSSEQSYLSFFSDLIEKVRDEYSMEGERLVMTLDLVASLRFIMKAAAEWVHLMEEDDEVDAEDERELLDKVCDLLEDFDFSFAKQYFVKILCRRYGVGDFQQLLDMREYSVLIPVGFNPQQDSTAAFTMKSCLFLLGEVYQHAQSNLLSVESEENFDEIFSNLSSNALHSTDSLLQILHGVHSWSDSSVNEDVKSLRRRFLSEFLEHLKSSVGLNEKIMDYFDTIRIDGNLQAGTEFSESWSSILLEFVQVAGSTILSSNESILGGLQALILNPQLISTSFLPTMPLSGYFQIRNVVGTWKEYQGRPPKAHLCPEGHVYFIGDCTNPNQVGNCPDCNELIGGLGALKTGNRIGEPTESSQAGYLLGNPGNRSASAAPERNCSRLVVCVTRMFLHASLIHACSSDHLIRHLKLNDRTSAKDFLYRHLQIDFRQLLDCVGKSAEDASLLLHWIMRDMRATDNPPSPPGCTLTTMDGRVRWEDEFNRLFLSPKFQRLDEEIDQARKICWSNQTQNDIERLVYEIPTDAEEDEPSEEISVETSFLWSYHVNVNVSHLRQQLEGLVGHETREGEVLKLILNQTDLTMIRYLPPILTLQNSLIQRFQRKVDAHDLDAKTIQEYCLGGDRAGSPSDFDLYIEVWNKVRCNLPTAYGITEEGLREEMSRESPLSMCLPSEVGKGRSALILAEYLLEKQNVLLIQCRDLIKPCPSFPEISVGQLTIDDLVCLDEDQALMPMILSNSEYEVTKGETGTKHKIVYRIKALEKQVVEKFILNKKLLNKTSLPKMKYLQDAGLGEEWEKMISNVPQEPLPHKISQKLSELCRKHRLSDICEGVRTIALVISYLAKLESNPEKLLISYITEDLMIPADEAIMVPKSVQLCHTMALYEQLSWQRSLLFVLNDQDPFANVQKQAYEEPIDDEISKEIRQSLSKIDISRLQLELNSLILLKQGLESHSPLLDNLVAYVNAKHSDDEDFEKMLENLPEELQVKHAPLLFKLSVDSAPLE